MSIIHRDHERSSPDALRTNHDKAHPVKAVKRFHGKRVVVDPLDSAVLGVPRYQKLKRAK
jgi:hypothetical protein